jgi:hypothetical protein
MILTGENRITRRKTCPSATLSTVNPTWIDPGANPGIRGDRPATTHLSHGTARRCPHWGLLSPALKHHRPMFRVNVKYEVSHPHKEQVTVHRSDVRWKIFHTKFSPYGNFSTKFFAICFQKIFRFLKSSLNISFFSLFLVALGLRGCYTHWHSTQLLWDKNTCNSQSHPSPRPQERGWRKKY